MRYLYAHVQTSIIHNSQEVGATQTSFDGWRDKVNVVETYKELPSSFKKERKNSIRSQATMWMKPDDMTLSEINSSQNESVYNFTYTSEEGKGTETE